jgi:signal transduction histidine kinase
VPSLQNSARAPISDISYRRRAQDRDQEDTLTQVQEEERRQISQELHDDLGQRVALLQIQIDQLEHRCESPDIAKGLRTLRESVISMDHDIHSICHRLYPIALTQLGLTVALEAFCREFSRHSGIRTIFVKENLPKHMEKNASLCVYRLVQEALHNVSKHSGAESATVILRGSTAALELVVEDSGIGFNPEALRTKASLGLTSMEQRVLGIGGRYAIRSRPGFGTTVTAVLPCRRALGPQ